MVFVQYLIIDKVSNWYLESRRLQLRKKNAEYIGTPSSKTNEGPEIPLKTRKRINKTKRNVTFCEEICIKKYTLEEGVLVIFI